MRRLLEFAVEHSLRFPGEPLKEIVIGSRLYPSGADFDPRLSAAVRVDATRLRAKLREYYDSEGATDRVVIELPKGSYVPVFRAGVSQSSVGSTANGAAHSSHVPEQPSIAVLPFSNLSPQTGDYFSDGLTDEIIHALASVAGMRVVGRASCFALKHKNADVREAGRQLNVDFLLEGSVRQSGEMLRVTVELVKTDDGYQVWSSRYDRRLDDVLAVQDDIAREIVHMLRAGSARPSRALPAFGRPNFEAYTCYLRGRYHLNRQTKESFLRAIECFEQALARDRNYAAALSGAGVGWLYLAMFSMLSPLEAIPKARQASARALEINPDDGDALSIVAAASAILDWDWARAEKLFLRSLGAHPGSDLSKFLFVMYLLLPMARIEEALEVLDDARRIDPLSLMISASRAAVLLMARRPAEAEPEYRRALELDPDFWRAIVGVGRCFEAQGRYEDAIACYERARIVSDGVATAVGALGYAYALAGRPADARRVLGELDELARHRYVSPYGRALIFLGLDDERVFECLERSCEERAGWLMYLATDPRFDPLRSDARFRSILRRLRIPLPDPEVND